jgi:sugar phosphate permease
MKFGEILLAWFITVLLGSAVCGFLIGKGIDTFIISIEFSSLFSLPYLIIFSLISNKLTNFKKMQLLHLLLAVLTAVVVYIIFASEEIFLVVLVYFLIGAFIHLLIHNMKKVKRGIED